MGLLIRIIIWCFPCMLFSVIDKKGLTFSFSLIKWRRLSVTKRKVTNSCYPNKSQKFHWKWDIESRCRRQNLDRIHVEAEIPGPSFTHITSQEHLISVLSFYIHKTTLYTKCLYPTSISHWIANTEVEGLNMLWIC